MRWAERSWLSPSDRTACTLDGSLRPEEPGLRLTPPQPSRRRPDQAPRTKLRHCWRNKNPNSCFMSKVSFLLSRARAQGGEGAELKQHCSLSRNVASCSESLRCCIFFFSTQACVFQKYHPSPPPTPPLILESDQSQATVL